MKIGIADTMFARGDMGKIAESTIKNSSTEGASYKIIRYTVPGVKDLPVACKKLFEDDNCDIIIACGYIGAAQVDQVCGHEASSGIQAVQLQTKKHIIEVFVHETEGTDQELASIMKNRVTKHAINALELLKGKAALRSKAGIGERQGKDNSDFLDLTAEPDKKIKLGIIVGEFNKEITFAMRDVAEQHAKSLGCTTEVIQVPGVFDMPLAIKKLMLSTKINGIILLGAVIKGETDHDDVIARTTSSAATRLSLKHNKPIGFGILGPRITWEQAESRGNEYAKRAVDAVLRMLEILRE